MAPLLRTATVLFAPLPAWREWPLVAFTLLGQFAAGFCLFAALPAVLASGTGEAARSVRLHAVGIAAAAVVAAAAISFFHLARPWNAPRAVGNLRSSWLSREILLELIFMALLGAAFLLIAAGRDGTAVRACAIAAGAAGVGLVAAMSGIYMIPGVAPWNRAATPAAFGLATVILGLLGAAAFAGFERGFAGGDGRALLVAASAVVAVAIVAHLLMTPALGLVGGRIPPSLKRPVEPSAGWFLARMVTLGLSGLLATPWVSGWTGWRNGAGGIAVRAAFVLAIASEIIGRFQFYSWGIRK